MVVTGFFAQWHVLNKYDLHVAYISWVSIQHSRSIYTYVRKSQLILNIHIISDMTIVKYMAWDATTLSKYNWYIICSIQSWGDTKFMWHLYVCKVNVNSVDIENTWCKYDQWYDLCQNAWPGMPLHWVNITDILPTKPGGILVTIHIMCMCASTHHKLTIIIHSCVLMHCESSSMHHGICRLHSGSSSMHYGICRLHCESSSMHYGIYVDASWE